MNCSYCNKPLTLKQNFLKNRIEPTSKYYKCVNNKIVEMYCSPECSLNKHEERK